MKIILQQPLHKWERIKTSSLSCSHSLLCLSLSVSVSSFSFCLVVNCTVSLEFEFVKFYKIWCFYCFYRRCRKSNASYSYLTKFNTDSFSFFDQLTSKFCSYVTSFVLANTTVLIKSGITCLLGPDIWHQPSQAAAVFQISSTSVYVCVGVGGGGFAARVCGCKSIKLQRICIRWHEQKYEHSKEPQKRQAAKRRNTTHKPYSHRLSQGNLLQLSWFPAGAVNAIVWIFALWLPYVTYTHIS